jgi:hypothetical protein
MQKHPRRIHVSFWQKDLTGLMGALRPQSPALLAAGAFGGNFQIGFSAYRMEILFFGNDSFLTG